MTTEIIQKSKHLIAESECILIGSGAGLTAASGINYTDKEAFAIHYPAWVKKGFQMQYQLMGYTDWTQAEKWGYYTVHLGYVYFQQKQNELYEKLRMIIGEKNYFSMTSNVDELFHKNGFDRSKIYSPQGSYGKIQCTIPCSKDVWDVKPFYDKMIKALDPRLQVLSDESAIPKCPNCGENMFLNVRSDNSFLDEPYEEERKRFLDWLYDAKDKQLLLLELGAGYNTPGVIRMPMEHIAETSTSASFIRVNMDYAQIPQQIEANSLSIQGDISNFIDTLV